MAGKDKIDKGSLINPSDDGYKGFSKQDIAFQQMISRGASLSFYHIPSRKFCGFRAFISSFTENYSTGWNAVKTIGRMDDIQRYSNTTRKISVSFDVPAESEGDAIFNFGMLSMLIKFQYPSYDSVDGRTTTLNGPPLIRLKFGNLIGKANTAPNAPASTSGLLGTMNGLTRNIKEEFGYFNPYPGEFYPRFFSISFDFTAMHEHDLGWGTAQDNTVAGYGSYGFERYPYNVGAAIDTFNDPISRAAASVWNDITNSPEFIFTEEEAEK